ncbi:MAG: tryptophan synthase subunit alpha [Planctomycetes bacterium]|nr:tryptophan synthase subunit alpha [Planctomycetota bacterium]
MTRSLRAEGRRGLSPYVTAGDGGMGRTLQLLHALERAGAHCCELGVPFSDPIADGPVLQAAADRALAAGTDVDGIFSMVRRFREEGGNLPIAMMSYCNPLGRRGWPEACAEAADVGVDALILPDLPVEEGGPVRAAADAVNLCTIFFAAPTSSEERIRRAVEASRGFLYVVGRTGVTGVGTTFDDSAQSFLQRVSELAIDLPVAVGFGISSAADVSAAKTHADIVIVGTALVRHINKAGAEDSAAVAAAESFVRDLMTGLGSPNIS